jgi:hypothetical protein
VIESSDNRPIAVRLWLFASTRRLQIPKMSLRTRNAIGIVR